MLVLKIFVKVLYGKYLWKHVTFRLIDICSEGWSSYVLLFCWTSSTMSLTTKKNRFMETTRQLARF